MRLIEPAPLRTTCWKASCSPCTSERKCSVPLGSCSRALRLMMAVDAAWIVGYFSDNSFKYFREFSGISLPLLMVGVRGAGKRTCMVLPSIISTWLRRQIFFVRRAGRSHEKGISGAAKRALAPVFSAFMFAFPHERRRGFLRAGLARSIGGFIPDSHQNITIQCLLKPSKQARIDSVGCPQNGGGLA